MAGTLRLLPPDSYRERSDTFVARWPNRMDLVGRYMNQIARLYAKSIGSGEQSPLPSTQLQLAGTSGPWPGSAVKVQVVCEERESGSVVTARSVFSTSW